MLTVSRETSERLEIYKSLIRKWNPKINLVATGDLADLQIRHIDDCLAVATLVPASAGLWADLGSGGGFPGLVIAIVKAETDLRFRLVESDGRKAAFLRTVIRETGLRNTEVRAERIEALAPLEADYVSARALAPLPQLMAYLHKHLLPTGKAFLMKGRQWRSEVQAAQADWTFTWTAHPSRTQDGAATLEISGVSRAAT